MERHFEHDLEELKQRLLWMGSLAERAVHQSVQAVLDGEERLAEAVLGEEDAINEMQIEIDERVQRLLALQAPMATDLRFLLAVSRINGDLERIGDQAVNIAQSAMQAVCRFAANERAGRGHGSRQLECRGPRRPGAGTERPAARRSGGSSKGPTLPRAAHLYDGRLRCRFCRLRAGAGGQESGTHRRPCHQYRRGRYLFCRRPRRPPSCSGSSVNVRLI